MQGTRGTRAERAVHRHAPKAFDAGILLADFPAELIGAPSTVSSFVPSFL